MRGSWKRLLLMILVVAVALSWYVHSSVAIRPQIRWLATQPGVATAFDAGDGGTDPLLVLLAFELGAPIAAFGLVLLLGVLVRTWRRAFDQLRLPEWMSGPLAAMALAFGTYATRGFWLPESLYVLGLVARAYLVFSSSVP